VRVKPPQNTLSDLLYNAEQLHADLLERNELLAAAAVFEAVTDLRVKVREEHESNDD
jgi:hypothetical protein